MRRLMGLISSLVKSIVEIALSRSRDKCNHVWTDLVCRTGRFLVAAWVDKYSHVVISTLLVFRRVLKDSRLSQLGHALLFLPFTIALCGTLGLDLDLILDGSTYERHAPAPTPRTRTRISLAAEKSLDAGIQTSTQGSKTQTTEAIHSK
jgi:hypothetical protein